MFSYLLKYNIAHPGVTCVIPASTNAKHVEESMKAVEVPLPDDNMRAKMIKYMRAL
jgi:aryl-alcohol dehydrogenase-like predicted oxidoreductase